MSDTQDNTPTVAAAKAQAAARAAAEAAEEAAQHAGVAVQSMKQADVHAQAAAASAADVIAAQTAPAPGSEVQRILQALETRLAAIEASLDMVAPEVVEAARVAGVVYPPAAPAISRISAVVEDMLAAFNAHFGGKIPSLPAPGAIRGQAAPT